VLVALAFGVSCRGFFQKNTLDSIAVQPPSPNIILTQTETLTAWGTYADSSRSQITSGVAWSSDTPSVVSIDPNSGVATGQGLGTATITASAQGLSGTASATVYITITSLTVTPDTWSYKAADGDTGGQSFNVFANGSVNVSSGATFTSTNAAITCANGTQPVICTAVGVATGAYTTTISVSYPETAITATINVTAN
jgi:pectin methylesterase-like acyl-CoA thioesterase